MAYVLWSHLVEKMIRLSGDSQASGGGQMTFKRLCRSEALPILTIPYRVWQCVSDFAWWIRFGHMMYYHRLPFFTKPYRLLLTDHIVADVRKS